MRRLRIWRYGTAAFKLDYALRAPVPWTAPAARAGVAWCTWAANCASSPRRREAGQRGEMPERPALVIGQHTLYDSVPRARGPATRSTATPTSRLATTAPTRRWRRASRRSSSASPPASADTVLARAIRNPQQTEAENPSLVGGDLGGGSLRARPAAHVPPRAGAVPPPDPAARPLRRGRLGPPGRLGAGDGGPLGRPGAARRPPPAPLARVEPSELSGLDDAGLGDALEPAQRLDVARSCTSQSVRGLIARRESGSPAVSPWSRRCRRPRGSRNRVTRAVPIGRARACRTSLRGGSTSRTSVWSLTLKGPVPTRWWKREPTAGQSGSASRIDVRADHPVGVARGVGEHSEHPLRRGIDLDLRRGHCLPLPGEQTARTAIAPRSDHWHLRPQRGSAKRRLSEHRVARRCACDYAWVV